MISQALTPIEYIAELPPERQVVMSRLREAIGNNIPADFAEMMQYGMINWVVPLSVYPAGYHCTPGEPISFIGIAAQKNFYALYHMGIYGEKGDELLSWFKTEYEKNFGRKLDAGKSCLRFKKPEHIPYDLIGKLAAKITARDFANSYAGIDPRNNSDRKKKKL